jgi:hypothetical protein
LRLGRIDLNISSVDGNSLLIVTDQIPKALCLPPQTLDRICHIFRLIQKSVSNAGSPIHIISHHIKNRWVVSNCADILIPILLINTRWVTTASQPACRIGNLFRVRRGWQQLRQQGVRVKRDGSEEVIKLLLRQRVFR